MAGLYIHVPFCKSKCAYCDFYSVSRLDALADAYADALAVEWQLVSPLFPRPDTIYIGGGTPSALGRSFVDSLGRWLPVNGGTVEFTVEVNPDDVTHRLAESWRAIGADRISMGVQSFNNAELAGVGRRHDARRAIDAYETLRRTFDNISIDLIMGLPGQTPDSFADSLRRALELAPEHLSAYILSYEPGTRLDAMRLAGKVEPASDDLLVEMYSLLCDEMRLAGYEHYEISNFALPGRRAVHNSSYWKGTPYAGLGPGAHSYDGTNRFHNPAHLRAWLASLQGPDAVLPRVCDPEDAADRINNTIMLGLRTSEGLALDALPPDVAARVRRKAASLPHAHIVDTGTRLYIPEEAWMVSDSTIASLFV